MRVSWLVLSCAVAGCGGSAARNATGQGGSSDGGTSAQQQGGRVDEGGSGSASSSQGGTAIQAGEQAGEAGTGGELQGPASAGTSSDLPRVTYFPNVVPHRGPTLTVCHDDDCPNGDKCFPITSEFGLCAPATLDEATQCAEKTGFNDMPDECGCDGLSCPEDQLCRRAEQTCSCAPNYFNRCVERPCENPTDCGQDVCVPSTLIQGSRCFTPECRSDADCKDPGMRCVVVIDAPNQAGEDRLRGTECVLN